MTGGGARALPVPNRVGVGEGGGAGVLRPTIRGDGGEEGLGVKVGSKSSADEPSRPPPPPYATRFCAAGANKKNNSSPSSSKLRPGVTM